MMFIREAPLQNFSNDTDNRLFRKTSADTNSLVFLRRKKSLPIYAVNITIILENKINNRTQTVIFKYRYNNHT